MYGLHNKTGCIRQGYVADMLILGANPLEDLANSRSIEHVIKAGKLVS
jgi:imidazolonepropionase-like amidohydrolase